MATHYQGSTSATTSAPLPPLVVGNGSTRAGASPPLITKLPSQHSSQARPAAGSSSAFAFDAGTVASSVASNDGLDSARASPIPATSLATTSLAIAHDAQSSASLPGSDPGSGTTAANAQADGVGWSSAAKGKGREFSIELDQHTGRKKVVGVWEATDREGSVHRVKYQTGYCYSYKMKLHAPLKAPGEGDEEPEHPSRIRKIFKAFQSAGLTDHMEEIAMREATQADVMLAHTQMLWFRVQSLEHMDNDVLRDNADYYARQSLYACQETPFAARLACGGVIEMCNAVAEGRIRNGFAIVRPPGHHAEPNQPMGFCFYNNVAVATNWLKMKKGIRKILIVDWDVHHGNGTQRVFWDDDDVLYLSIHRYDDGVFYPGTNYGNHDQVGGPAALGKCVNIAWPGSGMRDGDYMYAFQKIVMPIAYEFAPEFIIVSAGYDAAEGDALGQCHLSPEGYAHMTHMLSTLADGKLVLALEGGYDVDAIAKSAVACTKVLLGDAPPRMQSMVASEAALTSVADTERSQSRYWKCMIPTVDPLTELEKQHRMSLAEILASIRAQQLLQDLDLFSTTLGEPDLDEAFANRVLFSEDVYRERRTVLVIHELGNLRIELEGATADVHKESSYMIDTSRLVLKWARDNGCCVIDVNCIPRMPDPSVQLAEPARTEEALRRALIQHLVKNVLSLGTRDLFVVCVGSVSPLVSELFNSPTVVKHLVGVVTIPSNGGVVPSSASADYRVAFNNIVLTILPTQHQIATMMRRKSSRLPRYWNLVDSGLSRSTAILAEYWQSHIQPMMRAKLLDRDPTFAVTNLPDVNEPKELGVKPISMNGVHAPAVNGVYHGDADGDETMAAA